MSTLYALSTRRTARDGSGARTAGVILLAFGIIFLFFGVVLGSLCFIGGGVICSGTIIGFLGALFFFVGLIPSLLGIAFLAIGRKQAAAAAASGVDDATNAVASSMTAMDVTLATAPEEPPQTQPVSLNCPECGAPVARGAALCTYCGQTFA